MLTQIEANTIATILVVLSVGVPLWAILTDKKTYILKKDEKND